MMRMNQKPLAIALTFAAALCTALTGGCQRRERESSPFAQEETEQVLVLVFDLSSSFSERMRPGGPALEFALKTIDQYFRTRIGTQDKIVLAQLSASGQPLLFEGTPQELRKKFSDATAFYEYLQSQAKPGGSRVYDGVRRTVEYLQKIQQTKYPSAKGMLLVLSDMEDSNAENKAAGRAMLQALADYGAGGATLGFYFVSPAVGPYLDQHLRELGVTNFRVESSIVTAPLVPTID